MGLELNRVHQYDKEPGGSSVKLTRTTPYMRFCRKGEYVIFLQKGVLYYENGVIVKDVPEWVLREAENCGGAALMECGWDKVIAKVAPKKNGQTLTSPVSGPKASNTQFRRA